VAHAVPAVPLHAAAFPVTGAAAQPLIVLFPHDLDSKDDYRALGQLRQGLRFRGHFVVVTYDPGAPLIVRLAQDRKHPEWASGAPLDDAQRAALASAMGADAWADVQAGGRGHAPVVTVSTVGLPAKINQLSGAYEADIDAIEAMNLGASAPPQGVVPEAPPPAAPAPTPAPAAPPLVTLAPPVAPATTTPPVTASPAQPPVAAAPDAGASPDATVPPPYAISGLPPIHVTIRPASPPSTVAAPVATPPATATTPPVVTVVPPPASPSTSAPPVLSTPPALAAPVAAVPVPSTPAPLVTTAPAAAPTPTLAAPTATEVPTIRLRRVLSICFSLMEASREEREEAVGNRSSGDSSVSLQECPRFGA